MILVTGDDGADAAGLAALAAATARAGLPHVVFGNEIGWSSAGASLAVPRGRPAVVAQHGHHYRFADAPPALMVAAACSGLAGPRPDGVLVGVNPGPNVGRMALHSGTVGAAVTAAGLGVPAVAVSCDDVYSTGGVEDGTWYLDRAAELAVALLEQLLAAGGPVHAHSLNVPNLPELADPRPVPAAPADAVPAIRRGTGGLLETHVAIRDERPGTDIALLRAGLACVTTAYPLPPHTEGNPCHEQ